MICLDFPIESFEQIMEVIENEDIGEDMVDNIIQDFSNMQKINKKNHHFQHHSKN